MAVGKYFCFDLLGSVISFPVWWYTQGIADVARWLGARLAYRLRQASLRLWMSSLLLPMFGQWDWVGRLISIVMRVLILFARLLTFAIALIVAAAALLLWIVIPPLSLLLALMNLVS